MVESEVSIFVVMLLMVVEVMDVMFLVEKVVNVCVDRIESWLDESVLICVGVRVLICIVDSMVI